MVLIVVGGNRVGIVGREILFVLGEIICYGFSGRYFRRFVYLIFS